MNEEKVAKVCRHYQMDYVGVEEVLSKDHKVNSWEITKTVEEPQEFLGQIP